MESSKEYYITPAVFMLVLETEQLVCAQSGIGGNEDLIEDPENYDDIF